MTAGEDWERRRRYACVSCANLALRLDRLRKAVMDFLTFPRHSASCRTVGWNDGRRDPDNCARCLTRNKLDEVLQGKKGG